MLPNEYSPTLNSVGHEFIRVPLTQLGAFESNLIVLLKTF